MRWRKRDPYRWRRRFALRPRLIGEQWIWLSRYAWRPLKHREEPYHSTPGSMVSLSWEEWQLPPSVPGVDASGYTVLRLTSFYLGGMSVINYWKTKQLDD